MCFAHVSPVRHALTSSGLSVVNAPFRECVAFPLRSKRFRAEDRGFLSEAGQFPFGKPLSGVPGIYCSQVLSVFLLAVLLLEVSFSCRFSCLSYFLLVLVISGSGRCVCIYGDHGTHVWSGQGHVLDDTPVQAPSPDLDQTEA